MKLFYPFYYLLILVFLNGCAAHKSRQEKSFSGQYCTLPNYTGYCYNLHDDHRFEYSYSSCTYAQRGQGHYEIKKGLILFHFEPSTDSASRPKINIQKISTRTDSLYVDLQVFKYDGTPLSGCSATFFEGDRALRRGRTSDINGRIKWEAASTPACRVQISYTDFYDPIWVDIDSSGQYKVSVQMANTYGKEMQPPPTFKYRLVCLDAHILALGSLNKPSVDSLYKREQPSLKKKKMVHF